MSLTPVLYMVLHSSLLEYLRIMLYAVYLQSFRFAWWAVVIGLLQDTTLSLVASSMEFYYSLVFAWNEIDAPYACSQWKLLRNPLDQTAQNIPMRTKKTEKQGIKRNYNSYRTEGQTWCNDESCLTPCRRFELQSSLLICRGRLVLVYPIPRPANMGACDTGSALQQL